MTEMNMNKDRIHCFLAAAWLAVAAPGVLHAADDLRKEAVPSRQGRAPNAKAFDERLSLLGISFHVTSAHSASGNSVEIQPAGLKIDNSKISWPVEGIVTRAEVADINADGSPEVYVYVREHGPEERMSLVAYSANRKKSLSAIYLPPLAENPQAAAGYRGKDDLAVVEGVFVRRFPLYGKGGDPAAPTGKTRQLQYKLKPGEAGWVLRLDKMLEY